MRRRLAFALIALTLPFSFAACEEPVCPEGQTYSTHYEYSYGYNVINGKYEFHHRPVSECRNV